MKQVKRARITITLLSVTVSADIAQKTSHLRVGLDGVGKKGCEKTSHLPVELDEVGNEGHDHNENQPLTCRTG